MWFLPSIKKVKKNIKEMSKAKKIKFPSTLPTSVYAEKPSVSPALSSVVFKLCICWVFPCP
jgi:hypothetical protein